MSGKASNLSTNKKKINWLFCQLNLSPFTTSFRINALEFLERKGPHVNNLARIKIKPWTLPKISAIDLLLSLLRFRHKLQKGRIKTEQAS